MRVFPSEVLQIPIRYFASINSFGILIVKQTIFYFSIHLNSLKKNKKHFGAHHAQITVYTSCISIGCLFLSFQSHLQQEISNSMVSRLPPLQVFRIIRIHTAQGKQKKINCLFRYLCVAITTHPIT